MHIISSTGLFGAERVVIELLSAFTHEDIDAFLGILENRSNAHLIIAEEAMKYITNVNIFPCNGKMDIKTILSLRKFIEINKIDVIHSHGYKANFYGVMALVSKEIPHVATCHNWLSTNHKMKLYEWIDKKMLNKFDKIVAVSDDVERKILRSGVNRDKVLKIKNGINTEKYSEQNARSSIRAEFGIKDQSILIGSIGRLDRNKGLDYLIKAAKKLITEFNNLLFMIVGDGSSKQELLDEVDELGMRERIIFTGFRNDIPSILSAIDIFVLPSLMEGLPMVLLEAMASEKPIVATRVGDIPLVLKNNESGILINQRDEDELAAAIRFLVENKSYSRFIAEKGLERVRNEYSSKQMARRYREVYNDVLQPMYRK